MSWIRRGTSVAIALLLACSGQGAAGQQQEAVVTATAYNSLPGQTAGDPSEGAWGDRLVPGMRAIAISRDLEARGLKRGVEVEIDGLEGRYTVLDRMARRWREKIDIFMGNDVAAARTWGKRQITIRWSVPTPAVSASGEREIVVAVEVPNPCWQIEISGAFQTDEHLLVLSQLTAPEPGVMCAQVISRARDQGLVAAAAGPIRHIVSGRTWRAREDSAANAASESGDEVVFVADRAALDAVIGDAEPVPVRRMGAPQTEAASSRGVGDRIQ